MKVYHRKNFIIGISFLMLATVLALLSIPDEFTAKRIVLIALGLIFGIALLARSLSSKLSRKDYITENDEREIQIRLRAGNRTYRILYWTCVIGAAVSALAGGIFGMVFAPVFITFGALFVFMVIVESRRPFTTTGKVRGNEF